MIQHYRTGCKLRRVLYGAEVFGLLNDLDCGWLDGGCLILAEALHQVLGGELVMVVNAADPDWPPQHAAVLWDGWLWDGDGATRRRTFLHRWKYLEGVPRPRLVAADPDRMERRGTPRDTRLSCTLAAELARRTTGLCAA
jgi:hypothetical protein